MAPPLKFFTQQPQANVHAAEPAQNEGYTLAYVTYGDPGKPAVLIPSCFSGRIEDTLNFLYTGPDGSTPGGVLEGYFVIVCNLLGGSQSSSPSNAAPEQRGLKFPKPSYEDNIRIQHALCQALGIEKLSAYIGFSMGGQQAYHMATIFPDFVERIVVIAGSARTSWHNWAFLEGPRMALTQSVDYLDGNYTSQSKRGLRAFGRVYCPWALSQEWFRQKKWEPLGYSSLDEYMEKQWEANMLTWDANDLLCLLQTWQRGDISKHAGDGDLPKALASIKAKALIMPCRTDTYFPPEDSVEEVKHLKHGELKVIETIWGHMGGGGGHKLDNDFMSREVERFLAA